MINPFVCNRVLKLLRSVESFSFSRDLIFYLLYHPCHPSSSSVFLSLILSLIVVASVIDQNWASQVVHKIQKSLETNSPAYTGMCILDLSKILKYDFHYDYIKEKYGKKAKLLFTDTTSLTYEIETEDVYEVFRNDREKFDNSDYPEDLDFFDKTNKKVKD